MTPFSTKNADCGLDSRKLLVLHFILLICTVFEIEGMEVLFVESDKLKIIQKPDYLKICRKSDANFDDCLKSSLEKFMKSVNEGSSEHEIPSIDPVEIPLLEFDEGNSNFTCHVVLKSLYISGFKNFKILQVNSDVEDYKFEISLKTPGIDVKANVVSECDLYWFPVPIEGVFSMNLTNVFAVFIVKLNVVTSHSDHFNYFKVDKSLMEVLPMDVDINFENYDDSSNKLDSNFHDFLKRNAQELFIYLKPITQRILANVSEAVANEILSRHPQESLLPN